MAGGCSRLRSGGRRLPRRDRIGERHQAKRHRYRKPTDHARPTIHRTNAPPATTPSTKCFTPSRILPARMISPAGFQTEALHELGEIIGVNRGGIFRFVTATRVGIVISAAAGDDPMVRCKRLHLHRPAAVVSQGAVHKDNRVAAMSITPIASRTVSVRSGRLRPRWRMQRVARPSARGATGADLEANDSE